MRISIGINEYELTDDFIFTVGINTDAYDNAPRKLRSIPRLGHEKRTTPFAGDPRAFSRLINN